MHLLVIYAIGQDYWCIEEQFLSRNHQSPHRKDISYQTLLKRNTKGSMTNSGSESICISLYISYVTQRVSNFITKKNAFVGPNYSNAFYLNMEAKSLVTRQAF